MGDGVTGDLEAVLRAELALRDERRRARLFHPGHAREVDELFIGNVLAAAGLSLADDGKALRKARRGGQRDEDAAFGKAG